MSLEVNGRKPPRQARLDAWFVLNGIEKKAVAERIGVCPQRLSQILRGRYAKREHIQKLTSLGIPTDLLPPPHKQQKRGPKPRFKTAE